MKDTDIIKINELIMARKKQRSTVINYGNLEFAAMSKTPAHLMSALLVGHPFLDGNKRTAFIAAQLEATKAKKPMRNLKPVDTMLFLKQSAAMGMDVEWVRRWIERHQ